MNGFSLNHLAVPIFQDIPDEISEDWNYGVIVGGMASSDLLIARAYKTAGDTLVQAALESREPHEVTYPIIFVYRHALELYLKLIVKPAIKNHNLDVLLEAFERICIDQYGRQYPAGLKRAYENSSTLIQVLSLFVTRRLVMVLIT